MALPKAGVQLVAEGLSAFESGMGRADKAVADFGRSGASSGSAFDKGFGDVVTGALRQVGALGVEALLKAGQAVAGFVKDSIGLAGDFEQGMLNFQAIAGKDVDAKGLEQFRDLFIQIGKELPVSTADVQKAATEMIKGGIDPAIVAAGGLRQNIQFAAAAMDGDLVKAAEISSKILGGWSAANATAADKAAFLTHSTDLLTKAANASAVDVQGLSLGIFNAQGIAKTAGVSFDDLTTTLAALAPRFASSSEAGNSLKNMIARLQPTTDPAISAMEGLGLYTEETGSKFYDAQGNFIGFEASAQLLQESLKGLTNEQKAATLQQIFGNDAMGSAAALADLGAAGYQNMADAMAKANGVAENAALKQQGFNTALENAKGSVEALQITIGSALLPVLSDLMNNVIAPAVNTLTDMADALGGNEEAFKRLSPAAQDVVTTIEDVMKSIDDGIATVQDIAKEVQSLIGTFNQAGGASDTLGSALDDLNGVWNLALKVVQDVMDGYMAVAQAVLPIIQKFIEDHGTEISAFFKTTWDTIIDIITLALELYDSIVPPILQAIAGFISAHGDEIQKILSGVWTAVSAIITGALETIKTVIKLALDLIHGNWQAAWEDIKHILDVQWQAIKTALGGALDAIAGIFDTTLADLARTWENNFNSMVDIVGRIDWAAAGQSVVEGIIHGVESMASELFSSLEQMAQDAYDAFMAKIKGGSPAKEFMPAGASIVEGIMAGFASMQPALLGMVSDLGDDLIRQAQSLGDAVQSAMADAFGATATIDRQKVANLKAIADLSEANQAGIQGQLNAVEMEAAAMADPQQAQAWFKMRSQQMIELARLHEQIAAATDAKDKDRLIAQYQLINAANNADIKQFEVKAQGGGAIQKLIDQITTLMSNSKMPGIFDNPVVAQLAHYLQLLQTATHRALGGAVQSSQPYLVGENGPELFRPQSNGMIVPPASAGQIMSQGSTTTNTSTQTYNMPIYTTQSPAVLQNSMAMARAVMA